MQLTKTDRGFEFAADDDETLLLGDLYQCLVEHGFIHTEMEGVLDFGHFAFERGDLSKAPDPKVYVNRLVILEK